jgi:hypothetical protein
MAGGSSMKPASEPERWSANSGHRDVARLDIPADALRERTFEIFIHLAVANKAARTDARTGCACWSTVRSSGLAACRRSSTGRTRSTCDCGARFRQGGRCG